MRTLAVSLLLISAYLIGSESATAHYYVDKDDDNPDKCYDRDRNLLVSPDSPVTIEGCVEMSCTIENDIYRIDLHSCGVISYPSNCIEVADDTKDYPDCCPHAVCEEE